MMSDWLEELPPAAREYLEGKRLDEVECIIPDLPGIARGKATRDLARVPLWTMPVA